MRTVREHVLYMFQKWVWKLLNGVRDAQTRAKPTFIVILAKAGICVL
jgi:hypothetical protein